MPSPQSSPSSQGSSTRWSLTQSMYSLAVGYRAMSRRSRTWWRASAEVARHVALARTGQVPQAQPEGPRLEPGQGVVAVVYVPGTVHRRILVLLIREIWLQGCCLTI